MREGSSHLNYSVYHDRYRRTPDGWKFTERVDEIKYLDTTPLTGSPPRRGSVSGRSRLVAYGHVLEPRSAGQFAAVCSAYLSVGVRRLASAFAVPDRAELEAFADGRRRTDAGGASGGQCGSGCEAVVCGPDRGTPRRRSTGASDERSHLFLARLDIGCASSCPIQS
jgi:hypothetical protein